MKIYINKIKENWIVDRYKEDWNNQYPDLKTNYLFNADIYWIIAPWTLKKFKSRPLKNIKTICTIHHIDPLTFDVSNFKIMDEFIDFYHVISTQTFKELKKLTNKKIYFIPWWVDDSLWFNIPDKEFLRGYFDLKSDDYLIGSFQRDTEGSDLTSPKLIKGPDIFFEIIKNKYIKNKNLKVILAGTRRQYLIKRLTESSIPFKYFELVDNKELNMLYNTLDLYIVASRIEGGPQAILECAISKTPIISSNVGIAKEILNSKSIFNVNANLIEIEYCKPDIEYAFKNALSFKKDIRMNEFLNMFNEIYES